MGEKNVILGLVLTLSLSCNRSASFQYRPQISSSSRLSQAPIAKTYITRRQAATAIPGGVPSGKLERAAPSKPAREEGSGVTARPPSAAVSSSLGQGAPPGSTPVAPEAPRTKGGPAAATGAGNTSGPTAVGKALEAVAAEVRREGVTPMDTPTRKRKGLTAGPETTAAEKVLTLLEIGLVTKEEVSAYYEALSDLERTTREAKAVAAAAAASPDPRASSSSSTAPPYSPQDGPFSLVPFPAVCAALGAAGTHSLHLAGGLGTAISVFGAIAGVALGGLVVIGDDPMGKAARAAGSALARSAGAAGGAAGRSVSESAAEVAGKAAGAVEEAVVKAPASFVASLARSISSGVLAAMGSVAAFPGVLATRAADGAKGVLQDTSEAVAKIPGEVARKAAKAAGGALQSTSDAALTAVTDSPKKAVKRLNDAISSPGKTFTAFVSDGASGLGAGLRQNAKKARPAAPTMPAAKATQTAKVAPSREEKQEPEGIPMDELEAKMSSVRKALERFDTVKSRIEEAHTSEILRKTVSMTRSMDMSAEREKGEVARAAAGVPTEFRGSDGKQDPAPRASSRAIGPARATTAVQRKPLDKDRRQEVAKNLLEKASQRATQAKADLKAAAASARRQADIAAAAAPKAAVGGAEKKAPQEAMA